MMIYFLLAAYLLGAFLFWRQGREEGFSSDYLFDLLFISSFAGAVGGWIFFGELFLWAGAIGTGVAAAYLFTWSKKWSFFRIADLAVPAVAIAQGIGFFGLEVARGLAKVPYLTIGFFVLGIALFAARKRLLPGVLFFFYLTAAGLLFFPSERISLFLSISGLAGFLAIGVNLWLKRRQ